MCIKKVIEILVTSVIMKKLKIEKIEAVKSINHFTINEIIQSALKKRKLASHWIPHVLTDQNRKDRVEACSQNLSLFRNGPCRLYDIITVDESWFYLRQLDISRPTLVGLVKVKVQKP